MSTLDSRTSCVKSLSDLENCKHLKYPQGLHYSWDIICILIRNVNVIFQVWTKSNCCSVRFSGFTDHTTRRAKEMASEWSYKNRNSSYRGKFQ